MLFFGLLKPGTEDILAYGLGKTMAGGVWKVSVLQAVEER